MQEEFVRKGQIKGLRVSGLGSQALWEGLEWDGFVDGCACQSLTWGSCRQLGELDGAAEASSFPP